MGLKANIKGYLVKYGELKNARDNKIKEIKKSEVYSDEYKKQLIEKEQDNFTKMRLEIRTSMETLINGSKQKLSDRKKPISKDLAFELRLNNTLKTIELAGKNLNKEELKGLVEPFKADYGTMQSLFKILRTQDIETDDIIPPFEVDYKINELDRNGYDLLNAMDHDNVLQMSVAASMFADDSEGEE